MSFYEQTKVGNAFKLDQACSFSAQPRRKIKLLTLQEFHAANFLIELHIVTQSLLDFQINLRMKMSMPMALFFQISLLLKGARTSIFEMFYNCDCTY